jgi:hypothetical protein
MKKTTEPKVLGKVIYLDSFRRPQQAQVKQELPKPVESKDAVKEKIAQLSHQLKKMESVLKKIKVKEVKTSK